MAINTLTASALQGYNIHLDIGAVGDLLADFTPVYIAANPGQIVYVLEDNKCYVINADTASLDYLNIQGTPPITGLVYGNGAAAPTVATPTQVAAAASTQPVTKANNIAGGAANRIAVQTALDTTGFVAAPTVASTFLQWNGTALTWASPSTTSGTVTSVAATVPAFLAVTGSPITGAGTLAITLSGTALPVANGGTGTTTSTGTGSTVLSNSPVLVTPNLGTPSAAVLTNATGLPLSTGVVGTLTVPNGGTGVATLSGLAFGNGASAMTAATGAQVVAAIGSTAVQQATNVAGGAANQLLVQTGVGTTGFVAAPTVASTFLQWTGSAFAWGSPASVSSPAVGLTTNVRMTVATAAATATITADNAVSGVSLSGSVFKLSNLSLSLNLGTTGANGMDTGTARANSYVSVYAIFNPSTSVVAGLVTLASTSNGAVYSGANMPSGFTASCLLGIYPTGIAAGQFKAGALINRKVYFAPVAIITAGTVARTVMFSQSIATAVPPGAIAWGGFAAINGAAFRTTAFTAAADANGSGSVQVGGISNNGTASQFGASGTLADVPIVTAQTMFYTATVAAGTLSYSLSITSYTF